MNNISPDGHTDFSLVRRIPKAIADKKKRWLKPGDVLFCNTNSTELVGKTCLFTGWNEQCTYSNHLTRLRANPKYVLPQWLTICLRYLWMRRFFAIHCTEFIGQSAFNKDKLKEIAIPIPSLEEQRRIVARIEELTRRAEKARRLRQEAVEETSKILQAAIQSILSCFEELIETPVGQLCSMKTGKTPPTKNAEYFDGDVLFVCPSDLGKNIIISNAERKLTRKAIVDGKANLFKSGTVLLVGIGSTVGKVGIADCDLCTNQQITGLFFNNSILPEYAAWYLFTQQDIIKNAAAGGGVPIINQQGIAVTAQYLGEAQ